MLIINAEWRRIRYKKNISNFSLSNNHLKISPSLCIQDKQRRRTTIDFDYSDEGDIIGTIIYYV